ncbi:restriction endonuclease subunit S [Rhodoferax sp. TBRC 17660]|uniref:Restriction endonuclease subunit S n=1 Tax=Rhodoferax potami TaxID=3068338 RepID=A0ABU3KHV7_9BURK|nr:restriction endonuclease subunit S [Rhodoferax sp. TBRC 17660]MDT7517350.1 restriction endonuclease subunit S [Rhodoferax sp. TBRC 17660]
MTADQLITEHIDLWTAAIKRRSTAGRGSSRKIELYGIKKLRELILELAVRGLLVPQDPKDEPASELLKKIATERARLVKEGKIKQDKSLSSTSVGRALPYIPTGWACERFGNFAVIERGGSPRPIQSYLTDQPDGLNWIKIGDTDIGGKYIIATREKITKEGLSKTRMVYPGDFLLTNSMSFGRPYITKIEGCIHDGWLRISPSEYLNKDFLYLLLSSPYIAKAFTDAAAGAVVQNLNSEKVREVLILLPPLAEQHRIVAKVDELMALCDQLEQQTYASLSAHQTLVETLLNALTGAADHAQFASAWQRIAEHFDTLFTTEESIDQLKQTLLQLAVMGKLVPQDPKDEHASEPLKRIAAEKAKLVKEGRIKAGKLLSPIAKEETPFAMPSGWAVARLANVINVLNGRAYSKHEMLSEGTPILRVGNLFTSNEWYFSDLELEPEKYIDDGDLIFAWSASFGPFIWQGGKVIYHYHIWKMDFFSKAEVDKYFFRHYLQAISAAIKESGNGIAMIHMTKERMERLVLPIPPLAEQHRIVAKLDELMVLCDQLKSRLSDAQTTQLHLAEALAEQALVEA